MMDPRQSLGGSISSSSSSGSRNNNVKLFRPYFSPAEIEQMSAKQRGKLSVNREERIRQQACGFIDAVAARCGFPRKTISTAQTLYMRFHLFFPYKDFRYMEVCLSTLYVASKLHDTLKKPRDIILASYPLRFPHLVKKSSGGGGTLDAAAIDAHAVEQERSRVLGIERLVLEGVCFMFGVESMEGIVRIARGLGLNKAMTQSAWRMHVDCYRTLSPLTHPTHITSLGSIYACALLSLESSRPESAVLLETEAKEWARIVQTLGRDGPWEADWSASASDIDMVAHTLIDLHMTILSTPPSDPQHTLTPSPSSPRDPPGASSSRSSNHSANTIGNTAFKLSPYWTLGTLTELKVYLREKRPSSAINGILGDLEPRDMVGGTGIEGLHSSVSSDRSNTEQVGEGLGKNDGTVRFVWGDEVLAGG